MWNNKPECLGGLEIDDEIEFGRLLDRDVGGLRPAQNLIDQLGGAPKQIRKVCSVSQQTSRDDSSRKLYMSGNRALSARALIASLLLKKSGSAAT